MATLAKYKEHSSLGGSKEIVEIVYDFAVDGGAVGVLDVIKLKQASIITDAYFVVETTCNSSGAATVSLGKAADLAGIIGATAVASLVSTAGSNVIYKGTQDSSMTFAADGVVQMEIAAFALTAGKIKIVLEILKQ